MAKLRQKNLRTKLTLPEKYKNQKNNLTWNLLTCIYIILIKKLIISSFNIKII